MRRKIEVDPVDLTVDMNDVYTLMHTLETFHQIVPCDKITFLRQAPRTFEFKLRTRDNRTWTQVLVFDPGVNPDPLMTFQVPDAWRATEVGASRPMRDVFTAWALKYPQLESVSYKF